MYQNTIPEIGYNNADKQPKLNFIAYFLTNIKIKTQQHKPKTLL